MEVLAETQLGPFLVAPLALVILLCTLDMSWARRVHNHLRSTNPDQSASYYLGMAAGVWLRPLAVLVLGVVALLGNKIALALFTLGTIWRALPPGREAAQGFLAGFEESSGQSSPGLAAAFGAAWVGLTRGIPLMLLYGLLRAA